MKLSNEIHFAGIFICILMVAGVSAQTSSPAIENKTAHRSRENMEVAASGAKLDIGKGMNSAGPSSRSELYPQGGGRSLNLPFSGSSSAADTNAVFQITNTGGGRAISGINTSTSGSAYGLYGRSRANTLPASAVFGEHTGTGPLGFGVTGTQAGEGTGVYGFAPTGRGVYGASNSGTGVSGHTSGVGVGVQGNSYSGTGVLATSTAGVALVATSKGTGDIFQGLSGTTKVFKINASGELGIGTVNPEAKVHCSGAGTQGKPNFLSSGTTADFTVQKGENMQFGHWDDASQTFAERMTIHGNGGVTIGTGLELPVGYKLAVDGKMSAAEVTADNAQGAVTAALAGNGGENQGKLTLKHSDQKARVVLDGDGANNGGQLQLYDAFGTETINLRGDRGETGGGIIELSKTNGQTTITLDAEANGEGKITAHVLQLIGGSDLSEQFNVRAEHLEQIEPGMIVSIDPERPGELRVSDRAYDAAVAGVISGAGGVKSGMLMGQHGTVADGLHPVALAGRVYCRVDAGYGAIKPGDLITTSPTPGHGMKADPARAAGAIVGKAMTPLASGNGLVLVLVSLQ